MNKASAQTSTTDHPDSDRPMSSSAAPSGTPGRFSTVTRYYRKYRGYLIWGGIAVVLSNGLLLYTPKLQGQIVDGLKNGQPMSHIAELIAIMLGLTILSGAFRFMMRRTIIWMSRWLEFDLRSEMFNHLLRLTPTYYHNQRTGDIMARMTNDLEAVRQMSGPGIMYTANAITSLIIGLSLMIYMSPKMTLFAMLPLIVLPIAVNRVGNVLHIRQARIQNHFGDLTAVAQENIAGIRVVKAYSQEEAEIENFGRMSRKYINLNMDLARVQGVFMPLMRLVAAISYLLVLYVGGMQVIRGEAELGTMIAFFGYLGLLTWPVIAVGWVVSLYQRGTASLGRINRLLHTVPAVQDDGKVENPPPMSGKIEFRNLRFGYNGTNVLDGINLTIEPGQTVGLVGLTGSGKTTLVNLLARLHPVDRGQLFIDGIDINDWPLETLRSQIGFAPQEPFLFSNTIGSNIRFGRYDVADEVVEEASEIAALKKDVDEFPAGFDTIVGERGITLSGGQKQRTAIARAILVEPSILILDDATSAVDTETEHEISQRIKSVLAGRTSLVISHRVSSVKNADLIIYLQDGKIIEQGDHASLLAENGHYAELYRSQLLERELESL